MTNIVEVTWEDIKTGNRRDMTKCPIALALKRKFPNSYVRVDYMHIQIDDLVLWTNREMFKFQDIYTDVGYVENEKYDAIRVKPFSFDLDSLEPYWEEMRRIKREES